MFRRDPAGLPQLGLGRHTRLVYEVTHNAPPAKARYFLTVELIAHSDGSFWINTALEGKVEDIKDPGFIPEIPQRAMTTPWDSLFLHILGLAKQPFEPGKTYDLGLPSEAAEELRSMSPGWLDQHARLEVSGKEIQVAGIKAVEATLTLPSPRSDETRVWLALPMKPRLPYPVWVRPPEDAPWLSEIKMISYNLDPG